MSEVRSRPAGRWAGTNDGMTIVELLVALTIVMVAFAALAATLITSMTAIHSNEARVRATALANELIEEMAAIPWGRLGFSEFDPPVDEFGNPVTEYGGEDVVELPGAHPVMPLPEETIERDGRDYTVQRWITWYEDDGGEDLKRLVAIVSWEDRGNPRTIRSEGLRAPDPDDLLELEVTFDELVNDSVGDDKIELNAPGASNNLRNADEIRAEIIVGEASASMDITFRDRAGALQTLTTPASGGGTVNRTFLIGQNSYRFPHGPRNFTVTATGSGGQIATAVEIIRFYQPLEIQSLTVRQGGSATTQILVDCDFEPNGEVTIDSEVWGMTPGESLVGDLSVQWYRFDSFGDPIAGPEPAVPVLLSDVLATTVAGGEYRAIVDEDAGGNAYTFTPGETLIFRVTAVREVEGDMSHRFSATDFVDSVDVDVVQIGGCP